MERNYIRVLISLSNGLFKGKNGRLMRFGAMAMAAVLATSVLVAVLLTNRSVVSQTSQIYRWTVKFETGYLKEYALGRFLAPGQLLPYYPQVNTHINIYNPNPFNATLTKQFVLTLSELESNSTGFDGRTIKVNFTVPSGKGFEIDVNDTYTWDPDPQNPINWTKVRTLEYPLVKGFVIIESSSKLDVVAVYSRDFFGLVKNKITFHLPLPTPKPTITTPKGTFEYCKPYELIIPAPPQYTPTSLEGLVRTNLQIPPEDAEIEIVSSTVYFDFLECMPKKEIVFHLYPKTPPTITTPKGTFQFCKRYELLIPAPGQCTPTLIEDLVREWTQVPLNVKIEIIEVDVAAEGIGTSADVEYIQPEIITVP